MQLLKNLLRNGFSLLGLEIRKKVLNSLEKTTYFPIEFTENEKKIFNYIRTNNLSMTSDERLFSTILLCKYIITEKIPGDFVECGVWRGGNSILAASIFQEYGVKKKVYLFDTFEGMTRPTEFDRQASDGLPAEIEFSKSQHHNYNEWCYASLNEVQENFRKAGLLNDNIIFVKGDVLQTLAEASLLPSKISVLRLDTDWYESTKVELEILYPRVSVGGGIIIDDYGHWSGAKKATDEYFDKFGSRPLLHYIDYTGRLGIKIKNCDI